MAIFDMAKAQQLKFEQFTTKNGLLSDEVYNLHQDKKGYLWLFTEYGSMKYNGREFTPTLTNLPFKESVIYAIYERKDGRMWVANSNKNIYEVVNDSAFLVEGIEATSLKLRNGAQEIYQLYVDDSLNIYAKTWAYVFKFVKQDHYRAVDLYSQTKKTPYYEQVFCFGDGYISVWNATLFPGFLPKKGLLYEFIDMDNKKNNFVISVDGVSSTKYFKRFGKYLYFSMHNKIIRLDSYHRKKEMPVNDVVLNFTKDSNNHLWVACYRDGLWEYDEHDSLVNHYFADITINDVVADNSNGLWVSTDGQGIYHSPNINEYYYDKSSPLGKQVKFIKEIKKELFIGTKEVNVLKLNGNHIIPLKKAWYGFNDQPLDIISYKRNYLICYASHLEYLSKDGTAANFSEKPFFIPYRAIYNDNDTLLLLGRNRIASVHERGFELRKQDYPASNVKLDCKTFAFIKKGKGYLIGSDKGVFYFENGVVTQPLYLQPTASFLVKQIKQDPEGNYWFCTKDNGLFKLTAEDKLIHYDLPHVLDRNIVNDLYFLDGGGFLLCSNTGLYYHPGKAAEEGALGSLKKIYTGDVETAVLYHNRMYVGTKNGLVILNSNVLTTNLNINFNLRSIYINSKPANIQDLKSLHYWQNQLEFKFDIINYSQEVSSIKYNLEGEVMDSGVVNSDKLNFIELRPGNYTLTALPANEKSKSPLVIEFAIVPAIWQTAWFQILIIAAVFVVLGYIAFLYFRYNRNKALKKSESEKLIAEYRLIALKAQINPHFMSNCISAIQYLILNGKVDEANEYLAKFSFLVRQVLNLSNRALAPLKEELEIIELYAKLEKLRFDKINIEFHIDPEIDTNSTFIPPLLAQPIIENAIWHGLLPLSGKKNAVLLIIVKKEDAMIKIIIEDNGVGRKPQVNSIGNSRESKGIEITRQRIENLKYLNEYDVATLMYEDLTDSQGKAIGTRVVISLPGNLHL